MVALEGLPADFLPEGVHKVRPKPKKPFCGLFPAGISVHDDIDDALRSVIRHNPDMFCDSREGTKTWGRARSAITSMANGSLLGSYTWMPKWLTRMGVDAIGAKYGSVGEVAKRIDSVLSVCRRRIGTGLWFPKMAKGSIVKVTVADFLVAIARDGTAWSPFIMLDRRELRTVEDAKSRFTPEELAKLSEVLSDVWWAKSYDSMLSFYDGAHVFREWYVANKAKLCTDDRGRVSFMSFMTVLSDLVEANRETGCVGPKFVSPSSSLWTRYTAWLEEKRGVKVKC